MPDDSLLERAVRVGGIVMKRSLGLVALPLLVRGCLPLPITVASPAFTGISYVASGKSTTDPALSASIEQGCALTQPLFGEPCCRDVGRLGIDACRVSRCQSV